MQNGDATKPCLLYALLLLSHSPSNPPSQPPFNPFRCIMVMPLNHVFYIVCSPTETKNNPSQNLTDPVKTAQSNLTGDLFAHVWGLVGLHDNR